MSKRSWSKQQKLAILRLYYGVLKLLATLDVKKLLSMRSRSLNTSGHRTQDKRKKVVNKKNLRDPGPNAIELQAARDLVGQGRGRGRARNPHQQGTSEAVQQPRTDGERHILGRLQILPPANCDCGEEAESSISTTVISTSELSAREVLSSSDSDVERESDSELDIREQTQFGYTLNELQTAFMEDTDDEDQDEVVLDLDNKFQNLSLARSKSSSIPTQNPLSTSSPKDKAYLEMKKNEVNPPPHHLVNGKKKLQPSLSNHHKYDMRKKPTAQHSELSRSDPVPEITQTGRPRRNAASRAVVGCVVIALCCQHSQSHVFPTARFGLSPSWRAKSDDIFPGE
ncbi:hypothetical protein BJ508DRAFT_315957 [Ascobolus immersus RN42]|uniref:Uncharacterized protein n=1 Tax=Ascobolus immersus RN42 TaxID=1160509 RepID=A0A3N4H8H4_ASCIM|nr:hypothetical protein BJ508DRAFT_315957 [Ascobolus immersus RN42]